MDSLLPFIEIIGGDIRAVVEAALAWLFWQERKRAIALNDARFEDLKQHSKEMREVADNVAASLDGVTRIMEDRRNA